METTTDLSAALVEQVADAVIFADRAGRILIWNAAAEAVFGYPAHEAVGRRLDLLIPERLQAAHWAGYDTAIATGTIKHGREAVTTRSRHRDGHDIYVDLSFALVKDEAGEVLGSVAMARDVSERVARQRELRARLAELEAR